MPFHDAKYPPRRFLRRTGQEKVIGDLVDLLRDTRHRLPQLRGDWYGLEIDKLCAKLDAAIAKTEGRTDDQ